MARALVLLLLLFLASAGLAGCSQAPPKADVPVASSTQTSIPIVAARPASKVDTIAILFDGMLGTSVHGCVFPVNLCNTSDVTDEDSELLIERPAANLTGLSLTITWQSQTPATSQLTVGAMVMADCDDCNSTDFGEVTGTSPLTISVGPVDVPLTDHARLHVYAYNPQGLVYNPAVPAYGFVSVDQAFHVEGTATMLVPASP